MVSRIRKRINVDPNWKQLVRKAWSIKFILLAGFFSGLEAMVQIVSVFFADSLPEWMPRGLFAVIAFIASNGAFVSRLIVQKGMSDGDQ